MNWKSWGSLTAVCVLALGVCAAPASGQTAEKKAETKEKPAMYTYVGFWAIPRAQWADMDKAAATDKIVLDKAISDGTIVGYGHDVTLVHQADGITHDDWWSAMSMAGLLRVLDQFYKSGNSVTPVLSSATKHADQILVSRFYNWHSGSWKDVYSHGSSYKLKPDAPENAVETLSQSLMVPLLEKLLADGTIHEYEIDTEAIHTEAPGTFWLFYIAANAEALDKVNAAVRDAVKAQPLSGPAFDSMVDFTAHRDYLVRTTATYK